MYIPKYQWILPEVTQTNCDFCEELAIAQDYTPKFQLVANNDGDNLTPSLDFETNPFNPITTTTFSFGITTLPTGTDYFTLYCEGKVYVFSVKTGSSSDYIETIVGNLSIVKVRGNIVDVFRTNLLQFLNDIFDVRHGTTSSLSTTTFTISNLPTGSFLDDNLYNTLTNINTIGAQEIPAISVTNGYYDNVSKSICFYNLINDSFVISYELDLVAGKTYKFTFSNITDFRDWIDGKFRINDFTPSGVYEFDIVYGNVNTVYFTAFSTVSHIIDIVLDNATIPHTDGICFDDFSVYELEQLVSIEMIDCDGIESDVDYDELTINSNTLITINSELPNPFQLKFTDSNSNVFYSRWYSRLPQDECIGYMLLEWTSNCVFNEVDYLNLPFTNSLYVTGFINMQELDDLDSIDGISNNGSKISIYKNTQETYELRLHPYSMDTMKMLQRITQHNTVNLNSEEYNAVEIFRTSEIENGVYTGRVILYKKGTQLISSICCC